MANRQNVIIGIKFTPQAQVKSELDNIIKYLNQNSKIDLKINTGTVSQSLKDFSKLLDNINSKMGQSFNGNGLNNATTSINNTTSATRNLNTAFQSGSSSVMTFGERMSNAFSRMGVYMSTAVAFRELFRQFKEAVSYIETMDKATTNMQMITGQSANQIASTVNQFKQLGAEMHTTNTEVVAGGEELLRAGYNAQEAKSMMSASILGSKVSGQDTKDVTEQLITMKNAFNLDADSMEHYIDVMSKMDNTSATSFKEIANAVQRTAFSAQEAGTPLETLITYITTVSEKTRKSAESIGESFKTIYSRYSNIKLGNLDDDGKSINDTEKAMNRIGIQIRDGKEKFKEFDVVLNEFMGKYKSGQLSQVDYLAGVQALAGTRQRETLMALMENMDDLNKHQEDVANSAGSAKKMMSEAYDSSVDAKIQDLKRSFEGLYESILNSNGLKVAFTLFAGLIGTITSLNKSFGTLPTVLGLITTAFLVFKGQAILSFAITKVAVVSDLIAITSGETIATVATVGLSSAFTALKGVIMSNPLGLLAVSIAGIVVLMNSMETQTEKFEGALTSLKSAKDTLSETNDNSKLVIQYEELDKKIKSNTLSTDEMAKSKSDLLTLQQQLATTFPDLITG